MQNWFIKARENTDHILDAIKKQPFITELINGTLPIDVFEFYNFTIFKYIFNNSMLKTMIHNRNLIANNI